MNEKMAIDFVNKFPLMFNEDKDFWIKEINKLLNNHTSEIARKRKMNEYRENHPSSYKNLQGE